MRVVSVSADICNSLRFYLFSVICFRVEFFIFGCRVINLHSYADLELVRSVEYFLIVLL